MHGTPEIQQRPAQPYAGIRMNVTMSGLPAAMDGAFPELFGWLASRGITPAGAPFVRYHVIDMDAELEIEPAVPADLPPGAADGRVAPGVMPGGQYVVLRHTGPYTGMIASVAALLDWAEANHVALDSWDTDRGSAWRGRAEYFLTDPSAEPDPAKWQTDIAFLMR
jgi:effector-binding domain-containing protein